MVRVYCAAGCALVRIKVVKVSRKIDGEKRRSCDNGIGDGPQSRLVQLYRQVCTNGLARIVEDDNCRGDEKNSKVASR
jgi:hypothetical protein